MALFYEWGLTVSRLHSHCEETAFFTTQSPRVPDTHLIIFDGMKGWNNLDFEATQQIWIQDPGLGIQHLQL